MQSTAASSLPEGYPAHECDTVIFRRFHEELTAALLALGVGEHLLEGYIDDQADMQPIETCSGQPNSIRLSLAVPTCHSLF